MIDKKSLPEMVKTIAMLQEMIDDGFITVNEALVKAMQEGMSVGNAVYNKKTYKSPITYKEARV